MVVRDTQTVISIIEDVHPTIYGTKSLEFIIGSLRKLNNEGRLIGVILAGDFETIKIPEKLEKELKIKVIAFPGSHEGPEVVRNYPVEIYEGFILTPIGPIKTEILTTIPKTLGDLLDDKNFNRIVLIPGSSWHPSNVVNPVEPNYEIAKRLIESNNANIIISHEHPPGAMSAIATVGYGLFPIWYHLKDVVGKEFQLDEEEIKEINKSFQNLLRKRIIVNKQIDDPISAINRVLKSFYGKTADESLIKAYLILLSNKGYTVMVGYSQSPQPAVKFYNSMGDKVRLVIYGHIHEDSFLRKSHGYKVGNQLRVNIGQGFLGTFGILYPYDNIIEVFNAKQGRVIEEHQF